MMEINLKPQGPEYTLFDHLIGLRIHSIIKLFRRISNAITLNSNPEDSEAHSDLGERYLERKQMNLATAQFRTAIELDRGSYSGYLGLAQCTGNLREKVEYLSKATHNYFSKPTSFYYPWVTDKLWGAAFVLAERYGMKNPDEAAYHAVLDAVDLSNIPQNGFRSASYEFHVSRVHERFIAHCKAHDKLERAAAFYRAAMGNNPELYGKFFRQVLEEAGLSEEEANNEVGKYCKKEEKPAEKEKEDEEVVKGPTELGAMLIDNEDIESNGLNEKIARINDTLARFDRLIEDRYTGIEVFEEYARFLVDNSDFIGSQMARQKIEGLVQRCPLSARVNYEYGRFIIRHTDPNEDPSDYPKIIRAGMRRVHARQFFLNAFEADPDFNPDWPVFYREVASHYESEDNLGREAIAHEREHMLRHPDKYLLLDEIVGMQAYPDDFDFKIGAIRSYPHIDGLEDLAAVHVIVKLGKEEELLEKYPVDEDGNVKEERAGKKEFKYSDSVLESVLSGRRRYRKNIERIAEAKKAGDNTRLAEELATIGMYDDAIETADSVEQKGQREYRTIGYAYESKWLREGKRGLLENAYEAYNEAERIERKKLRSGTQTDEDEQEDMKLDYARNLEHLAMIAALLGRYRDISLFRTLARAQRGISKFHGRVDRISTYKKTEPFHKKRMRDALMEVDIERRIEILTEIDDNTHYAAKSELGKACAKYAPKLAEEIRALAQTG